MHGLQMLISFFKADWYFDHQARFSHERRRQHPAGAR